MMNSRPQLDFNQDLTAEFVEALLRAKPYLEELVTIGSRLFVENTKETLLPCDSCLKLKEHKCNKPCEALEAYLPRPYGGKTHGEGTIGLDFDNFRDNETYSNDDSIEESQAKSDRSELRSIKKISRQEVLEEYKKCWAIYTEKERIVLVLRHGEGKTIRKIAKEIGKAQSTVCGLLKRAEKRKREYDNREVEKILKLKNKIRKE